MTATLVEHAQYILDGGTPIVGGSVYIGTNGADPVATSGVTTIFADRDLTTTLSNPQLTGSDGRSVNKIWVSGKYSIQVNDSDDVQQFQDLDAGTASSANTTLFVTSIVGSDTITGSTDESLSSYTANQQFVFATASINTDAITLNVDSVGAKSIVKNNTQPILPGEFPANQVVIVVYNETNDNFEWTNQNVKNVQFSEGSDVVAATTTNIWDTGGNTTHITGSTAITSFGTAPNVGARRWLIFDSTPTLTQSTNLNLPGGVDYITKAGEVLEAYADTVTQIDVRGSPLGATTTEGTTGTQTERYPDVAGVEAMIAERLEVAAIATIASDGTLTNDRGIASSSKISTGLYEVTLDAALANANYTVVAVHFGGTATMVTMDAATAPTTTVFRYNTFNSGGTLSDRGVKLAVME